MRNRGIYTAQKQLRICALFFKSPIYSRTRHRRAIISSELRHNKYSFVIILITVVFPCSTSLSFAYSLIPILSLFPFLEHFLSFLDFGFQELPGPLTLQEIHFYTFEIYLINAFSQL